MNIRPMWVRALVFFVLLAAFLLSLNKMYAHAYPKLSQSRIHRMVDAAYVKAGVPKKMWKRLDYIWTHESRNNLDGGRYRGIWQLRWTMCKKIQWRDPYHQTLRAIRYMRHRYGKSMVKAYIHKRTKGWY